MSCHLVRCALLTAIPFALPAGCSESSGTGPEGPHGTGASFPDDGAAGTAGGAQAGSGGAGAPGDGGPDAPQDQSGPVDAKKDVVPWESGPGTDPEILSAGAKNKYLLLGTVVTPDTVLEGEVLVESNVITCVAPSCQGQPGAAGATVIDTHGMIFPGLIDAHNHILYDVFDESDWTPSKLYANHNQWTQEAAYNAMQGCYDYLLDSPSDGGTGGVNLDCEVLKYGEIKGMIAGTTSILGEPKGSPQKCYESLSRSIDGQYSDLPPTARPSPCTAPPSSDHIQVASLGIDTVDEAAAKANFQSCKTWSYVVHVGEGVPGDTSAYGEWNKLKTKGLDVQQMSVIHGTSFEEADFQHMAGKGMKLVWSPKSNMFLYGKTTRIDLARKATPHLVIALAPDWSMGGSVNILDELSYAYDVDQQLWGGILTAKELVAMVTIEAARALEVHAQLGSVEQGKLADLVVVSGDRAKPYESLVHARPGHVRLVMVNGAVLYGDGALAAAASIPECETIDVCGRSRFLCVKEQSSASKLNQTYAEIVGAISKALGDYDTAHGTKFSPIAPLVKCP